MSEKLPLAERLARYGATDECLNCPPGPSGLQQEPQRSEYLSAALALQEETTSRPEAVSSSPEQHESSIELDISLEHDEPEQCTYEIWKHSAVRYSELRAHCDAHHSRLPSAESASPSEDVSMSPEMSTVSPNEPLPMTPDDSCTQQHPSPPIEDHLIAVAVTGYEQRGRIRKYIVYKVETETDNMPNYNSGRYSVFRRMSEFYSLQSDLEEERTGYILPVLPDKDALKAAKSVYNTDVAFLESRRQKLQEYLEAIVSNPVFVAEYRVRLFLTDPAPVPPFEPTRIVSKIEELHNGLSVPHPLRWDGDGPAITLPHFRKCVNKIAILEDSMIRLQSAFGFLMERYGELALTLEFLGIVLSRLTERNAPWEYQKLTEVFAKYNTARVETIRAVSDEVPAVLETLKDLMAFSLNAKKAMLGRQELYVAMKTWLHEMQAAATKMVQSEAQNDLIKRDKFGVMFKDCDMMMRMCECKMQNATFVLTAELDKFFQATQKKLLHTMGRFCMTMHWQHTQFREVIQQFYRVAQEAKGRNDAEITAEINI